MSEQTTIEQTEPGSAPEQAVAEGERDFSGEIDALIVHLQENPDDGDVLQKVALLADEWAASEGLTKPSTAELEGRSALASWLGRLASNQGIVHFGWRCPAISEALASSGREVVSFLDHPARAMAASIRQETGRINFGVLGQEPDELLSQADLVVVETAASDTVVPIDFARRFLRPGGWLAVIGVPVLPPSLDLLEAGTFVLDGSGNVQPTRNAADPTQLSLYRYSTPSSGAENPRANVLESPDENAEIESEPRAPVLIDEDPLSSSRTEIAHIEFTTRCTLRCVYCAVSQPTYKGFDMDIELVDDLVDMLEERKVKRVVVNGHGETTMVKGWHEQCDKLIERGMRMSIISNFGRLFTDEECDTFSRFDSIEVSVDSADPALLKKLRRKVDLSTIIHNMARVRAAAISNKVVAPQFSWSCVVNDRSIWGVREVVQLGLVSGATRFTFCNLTKYPDVDDALNVRHVTELEREEVAEARQILNQALDIASRHGAGTYVQPGLIDTMREKIEGRADPLPVMNNDQTPDAFRRYTVEAGQEGMTRDCLDPWTFAMFSVNEDQTVLKPCCWHPNVGTLVKGEDPAALFEGPAIRELREQLHTGRDLNRHCNNCPARGWVKVEEFQDRLRKHQGRAPAEAET